MVANHHYEKNLKIHVEKTYLFFRNGTKDENNRSPKERLRTIERMPKMAEKTKTARINLTVPFWHGKGGKNKAVAYVKKCGAYYDPAHKVWYTYAGHRSAKYLAKFMSPADKAAYGFDA